MIFLTTLPTSSRRSCARRRKILESQYRHIPAEDSPITYPLKPQKIAVTPIPLARGAEKNYRFASIAEPDLADLEGSSKIPCRDSPEL